MALFSEEETWQIFNFIPFAGLLHKWRQYTSQWRHFLSKPWLKATMGRSPDSRLNCGEILKFLVIYWYLRKLISYKQLELNGLSKLAHFKTTIEWCNRWRRRRSRTKSTVKNTIRDGGSTALYTAYNAFTVYTVVLTLLIWFTLLTWFTLLALLKLLHTA